MKKAAIYIRIRASIFSQKAIDEQFVVCKQYADECGFEIVDKYIDYETLGQEANRISFSQMMNDSQSAKWDAIIAYSADRICRNAMQFVSYKKLLDKYGKSLLFVNSHKDKEVILK